MHSLTFCPCHYMLRAARPDTPAIFCIGLSQVTGIYNAGERGNRGEVRLTENKRKKCCISRDKVGYQDGEFCIGNASDYQYSCHE